MIWIDWHGDDSRQFVWHNGVLQSKAVIDTRAVHGLAGGAAILLYPIVVEPARIWNWIRERTEALANSWREWRAWRPAPDQPRGVRRIRGRCRLCRHRHGAPAD